MIFIMPQILFIVYNKTMQWKKERQELVEFSKKVYHRQFVTGVSGNLSIRVSEKTVLITPKAKCYETLQNEDIVAIDIDGNILEGTKQPSSEYKLHLEIYKARKDVNAIIHTHSVFACSLATMNMPLPVIVDEQETLLGGQINVTQYEPSGTEKLAKEAVKALEDKKALLLARHGAVSVGKDLKEAFIVCETLERLCQVYFLTCLLKK